jgi:tetratricopeptide (TPR) repeat protein
MTNRDIFKTIIIIVVIMITNIAEAGRDTILYKKAMNDLKNGRHEFAFMKFWEVVRDYPDSKYAAESHFRVAEFYFNVGSYVDAERELSKHLRVYPESPFKTQVESYLHKLHAEALVNKGDLFYSEKRWKEALDAYIEARKLNTQVSISDEKFNKCKLMLGFEEEENSCGELDE